MLLTTLDGLFPILDAHSYTDMINRREFIKTSAVAASGMVASTSLLGQMRKSPEKIQRVGLQVWSIAKFLQQNFTDSIAMLSRAGYKEIELFGPYPFSTQKDKDAWAGITQMLGFSESGYFNHTAKEFRDVLDHHGLTSPAMHIGLDTLRNKMAETAEAAHILGQRYAGIAAIPQEERGSLDDYKRLADEFNMIGEKAKKHGIRFYYHNHGYGLSEMEGIIPFDLILDRTDPSLVFFEMDIFWHTAGGADPVKYLDKYPGRFKLMHVKDMAVKTRFSGDGGNPQQWVELFQYIKDPGNGVLDLKTILSHAKESGVEHFIIENDVMTNPKQSLEKGFKYVSSLELRS